MNTDVGYTSFLLRMSGHSHHVPPFLVTYIAPVEKHCCVCHQPNSWLSWDITIPRACHIRQMLITWSTAWSLQKLAPTSNLVWNCGTTLFKGQQLNCPHCTPGPDSIAVSRLPFRSCSPNSFSISTFTPMQGSERSHPPRKTHHTLLNNLEPLKNINMPYIYASFTTPWRATSWVCTSVAWNSVLHIRPLQEYRWGINPLRRNIHHLPA